MTYISFPPFKTRDGYDLHCNLSFKSTFGIELKEILSRKRNITSFVFCGDKHDNMLNAVDIIMPYINDKFVACRVFNFFRRDNAEETKLVLFLIDRKLLNFL